MDFKRFTVPSEETVEDAGDDFVDQIVELWCQKMAETDIEDDIIEPGCDGSVGDIIQA